MGFAWLSFVPQEALLGVCGRAALHNNLALSIGRPVPTSTPVFFVFATDDVMLFPREGSGLTLDAARVLDTKLVEAGIERHEGKDENDVLDSTSGGAVD